MEMFEPELKELNIPMLMEHNSKKIPVAISPPPESTQPQDGSSHVLDIPVFVSQQSNKPIGSSSNSLSLNKKDPAGVAGPSYLLYSSPFGVN
ncbi:hypothetical protein CQ054_21195 [Ochrobactrum sp. MYb29]|nr:hypothetical protein CWE02_09855 [Brucella pituitosa]PRA80228.1 hypothetical protein CQ054_21195 [Ochrobactrum sp. MYb29]